MRTSSFSQQFAVVLILLLVSMSQGRAEESTRDKISLFVADGQLISHPFRVLVEHYITQEMGPTLQLRASHTFTTAQKGESKLLTPFAVATNQTYVDTVAGQTISRSGTLLLFDLQEQQYPVSPYKGMTRVTPILTWTEPAGSDNQRIVVAPREVNLGNIGVAVGWTILLTAILVSLIAFLARRSGHPLITFFCGDDGRLSLARTQVALWTLAIGMVVGGYGMLKLEVPDIPDTLVILMGLSLATGGVSYIKSDKKASGDAPAEQFESRPKSRQTNALPRLSDLVCIIDERGSEQLSLVRAQMIFWTGLTVAMFMVKSVLDGVLWNIPMEMVFLMGMSQAAYLSPKLMQQPQQPIQQTTQQPTQPPQ